MKHYQDRPLLIFLNMAAEFILVAASYICAGALRVIVGPFLRKAFGMYDTWHHFFLVVIMGTLIVAVLAFLGDYRTIHYYKVQTMAIRVTIVHIVAILTGFSVLYTLRNVQMSRAMLVIFFMVSDTVIIVKRIIVSRWADELVNRKQANYRVLVIGGGEMAKRYYRELASERMKRYKYVGYVADQENAKLPGYMGAESELTEILKNTPVDQVVIAGDVLERFALNTILSICSVYGIRVFVIPVFNDYLSGRSNAFTGGRDSGLDGSGLNMFELSAMKTSDILGVHIAVTNMEKTIREIGENLDKWKGKYICVSNVHTTVMAHEDAAYRRVQNGAVMALPDGGPLSAYSRSTGSGDAMRVTGPDLMREILSRSGEQGWKHFFYGSRQETLDRLADVLKERYPGAQVAGMISPPFRELTPEEDAAYVEQINAAQPDFVWVGLGAPKQEIWMAAHENRVHALMVGVGAAFDYESGNIKRAPMWMQKLSLEWLYRLLQDPKRLFKRYFVTNIKYLWLTRR